MQISCRPIEITSSLMLPPAQMGLTPRTENSQNVPEQQCDAGKQNQRGRNMLVRSESVQNIRRLIEDRRSGKRDHYERKNVAERKAENKARNYKSQGRETADRQDRCEE